MNTIQIGIDLRSKTRYEWHDIELDSQFGDTLDALGIQLSEGAMNDVEVEHADPDNPDWIHFRARIKSAEEVKSARTDDGHGGYELI